MGLEDLDLGDHYRYVKDVSKDETVDVTTCGGVTKKCIAVGGAGGRPGDGSRVTLHATGKLDDGTVFEDTRTAPHPITFRLGQGRFTQGFDLAIKTMRKGEKAIVTIKPKFAYGPKGCAEKGIPGNAVLIWEVELLDFVLLEDVTDDRVGGVLKEILVPGVAASGPDVRHPCYEAKVVADVRLELEQGPDSEPGQLLLEREKWEFVVGMEEVIPEGAEEGLCRMVEGEKAAIHVLPVHAWGGKGCAACGAPPGERIRTTITLHSFTVPNDCWPAGGPENWELSLEEIIEGAERRKKEANEMYKEKKLQMARRKYASGVRLLDSGRCKELAKEGEAKAKVDALLLAFYNNLAAVHLALQEWNQATTQCSNALRVDPACVKAYLRRAKAQTQRAEWDYARKDLDKILEELDKDNEEAKKELEQLRRKRQQHAQKEKAAFGKMFATKEP